MKFIDQFMEKWEKFLNDARPTFDKVRKFLSKWKMKISKGWNYVKKFRKIFLTVPVGVMAVILALGNMFKLPSMVGVGMPISGGYSIQVAREVAVLGPMAITALCILLLFSSKRTLTPFLVSICSLVLPIIILISNTFPA